MSSAFHFTKMVPFAGCSMAEAAHASCLECHALCYSFDVVEGVPTRAGFEAFMELFIFNWLRLPNSETLSSFLEQKVCWVTFFTIHRVYDTFRGTIRWLVRMEVFDFFRLFSQRVHVLKRNLQWRKNVGWRVHLVRCRSSFSIQNR